MAKVQLEAIDKDVANDTGGVPGVQALTRGIQIVDAVAAEARGLRFTELLDQTQLPKGTLHRLLQALVDERLLHFDTRDQVYRLAPRLFNGRTRSGTISICAARPNRNWRGFAT